MDKKILTICAVAAALHATAECPEGACPAEGAANAAEGVLTLECPVAPEPAPAMPSAPRLETLAGKTFAVVGGSFMAKVTHPELKRLILAVRERPRGRVPAEK